MQGFENTPHPLKNTLTKELGLSISQISNYLGLTYPYVSNILSSLYRTRKHDKRLQKLVDDMKANRRNN